MKTQIGAWFAADAKAPAYVTMIINMVIFH